MLLYKETGNIIRAQIFVESITLNSLKIYHIAKI